MEFKTLEKVYFRQKLLKSIQFKTTFKGKRKRKTKKKNLKEIIRSVIWIKNIVKTYLQ